MFYCVCVTTLMSLKIQLLLLHHAGINHTVLLHHPMQQRLRKVNIAAK